MKSSLASSALEIGESSRVREARRYERERWGYEGQNQSPAALSLQQSEGLFEGNLGFADAEQRKH